MSQVGTLPFNKIPSNQRDPLFFVEFDNTQANTATAQQRALLIGQLLSTGTAVAGTPVQVISTADAKTKFGIGSMAAMMVYSYRLNDPNGELWVLPLSDDGSAVKATGTIAFTAAATAAGVLYTYIAGQLVTLSLTGSQTTAQIATALAAAINAMSDLPCTATASTSTVTLTARNGGAAGNDIDIEFNFLGAIQGQVLPTGLAATITAMANGAVNPSLTTPLANCVDKPFDFVCNPYTDSTSLNSVQTFLNDTTGRWSYNRQVYGHSLGAFRGTQSSCNTLGLTRNNQHESIVGFNGIPQPNWQVAAAMYAACAVALKVDPGRPMQTLQVQGLLPPPSNLRFSSSDRQGLLYAGISTFTVSDAGAIAMDKVITTYQTNAFSQPDNSYLGIEVMFQLMFLMRDLATYVTSKYPRAKLAASGSRLAPGSGVVTPAIILQDMIGHYRALCYQGFAQNPDGFAASALLLQDPVNPNRLNFLWTGTLMDQLNVFATLAQFRNQ